MTIIIKNVINLTMQNITLCFKEDGDLIFVDKPSGLPTHAPDTDRQGMAEILQSELKNKGIQKKIFVVHRLDKTTTGAMVFATSEIAAKRLFEQFKNHQVQKKYYFITESKTENLEFECISKIEKVGNKIQNIICKENEANAWTQFRRIKINHRFQWWEAIPKSGKPHQVRIHASQAGIPILGDALYGGSPFPHLCLHAFELHIPGFTAFTTSPPLFFERMGLLRDAKLCAIISSWDRRERLYQFLQKPKQCLRLAHTELEFHLPLRIDQFGDTLWYYWYGENDPDKEMLNRFEFSAQILKKKLVVRKMQNRGTDANDRKSWEFFEPGELWLAEENNMCIQFRKVQGLSPGLFLDQRENRKWLFRNSKNKKVLNLFSYTCGFSLAAALGQAKEVISVDLSKNFLEWGKINFEKNGIDPKSHSFYAMDSIKFLNSAIKNQNKFDVIICDPPSFSRNQNSIFKIEKDFELLIAQCLKCLNKNGTILLSTNFEKWTQSGFENQIDKVLKKDPFLKAQFEIATLKCLDFELPDIPPLMKSTLIIL